MHPRPYARAFDCLRPYTAVWLATLVDQVDLCDCAEDYNVTAFPLLFAIENYIGDKIEIKQVLRRRHSDYLGHPAGSNSMHVTNQSFMYQWQFSNTADSALPTRLVRKSPLYLKIFARSEPESRKRVCKAPALTRHRSCRPHGRLFFHTLLIRRVAHISERLVLAQADLCRQARNALRVRVITVSEIALEKQLLQL